MPKNKDVCGCHSQDSEKSTRLDGELTSDSKPMSGAIPAASNTFESSPSQPTINSGSKSFPEQLAIVFDVGGTSIKLGLADKVGNLWWKSSCPTPKGGDNLVKLITAIHSQLLTIWNSVVVQDSAKIANSNIANSRTSDELPSSETPSDSTKPFALTDLAKEANKSSYSIQSPISADVPTEITTDIEIIKVLRAHNPHTHILDVTGVAVPGVVQENTGMAILSVNLDWKDFPMGHALQQSLGTDVVLCHDVRSGALAEATWNLRNPNCFFIALGTGLASGLVLDGKVISVAGWSGEIGQIPCPNPDYDILFEAGVANVPQYLPLEKICGAKSYGDRFYQLATALHINKSRTSFPASELSSSTKTVFSLAWNHQVDDSSNSILYTSAPNSPFTAPFTSPSVTYSPTSTSTPSLSKPAGLDLDPDSSFSSSFAPPKDSSFLTKPGDADKHKIETIEDLANHVVNTGLDMLGKTLAQISAALGPIPIVVGGGLANEGVRIAAEIKVAISRHLDLNPVPQVALATLGSWAQCIGVAAQVFTLIDTYSASNKESTKGKSEKGQK